MPSRISGVFAVLAVVSVAGCGAGHTSSAPSTGVSPQTSAAATGYTTDQLVQALLTQLPNYQPSGSPQSGAYGELPAVQNFDQLQSAVKLDRPACAAATRAFDQNKAVQAAPAALTTFVKGTGQSLTETLLSVGPDTAIQQVRMRVPAGCHTFGSRTGGQSATSQVVEEGGVPGLGEGSRSVGVTTSAAGTTVTTWYVVLRSRGYLATITLYGPDASRVEAERLARTAYQQAERILP